MASSQTPTTKFLSAPPHHRSTFSQHLLLITCNSRSSTNIIFSTNYWSLFSRPPVGVSTYVMQLYHFYWYPGRKLSSINGSPRNFHTKFAWSTGRWPTFRNFNFPPPKIWRGKTPKFRQILPNGRQSEIRNFETARHIDKRIVGLSSAINGLKDGTKLGGTPTSFDAT